MAMIKTMNRRKFLIKSAYLSAIALMFAFLEKGQAIYNTGAFWKSDSNDPVTKGIAASAIATQSIGS